MTRTIDSIDKELLNIQTARMAEINANDKHFKAIEADLKNLTLSLSLQTQSNSFLAALKEEVKKNNEAQITLNKLFAGQIKELQLSKISITPVIKPEVKIDVNYLLNWFKRK